MLSEWILVMIDILDAHCVHGSNYRPASSLLDAHQRRREGESEISGSWMNDRQAGGARDTGQNLVGKRIKQRPAGSGRIPTAETERCHGYRTDLFRVYIVCIFCNIVPPLLYYRPGGLLVNLQKLSMKINCQDLKEVDYYVKVKKTKVQERTSENARD